MPRRRMPFVNREQWLEQRVAKLLDFGSRRKERLTGPASRDLLEIGIFHFQCHRAPANLCSLASAPDLFDDRLEHLACGLECEDIGGKGVFRTKRLAEFQPLASGSGLALASACAGARVHDEYQSGCSFHRGDRPYPLGRRNGTKRRCTTGSRAQLSRAIRLYPIAGGTTSESEKHSKTAINVSAR